MKRSRMVSAVALSLVFVLVGGAAQSVVQLQPVITGKADQYFGFANDAYLVYTQWARSKGARAMARRIGGGSARTLNAAGTEGATGGFDPGTNRVIYQQWKRSKGRSDLFFYDLDTGRRSKVPGVNTRAWEFHPRISSTFIAFQRARYRKGAWYISLQVLRRETGRTRTLGTWKDSANFIQLSSVGDRYLAYTHCNKRNCFADLYDLATNKRRRIPTVNRRPQYAPVVDEVNSTVYFTRSGSRCGRGVNILRLPLSLSGTATKIVGLPRGIDTGWDASLTENASTGKMDLFIERWNCKKRDADVYVARGVDDGSTPEPEPEEDGLWHAAADDTTKRLDKGAAETPKDVTRMAKYLRQWGGLVSRDGPVGR